MNIAPVTVLSLVQGGAGKAVREDGKTLLIQGALPGERVSYRITDERKSWAQAQVDAVLESSPDRVAPLCPYYGICGGCDFMHLDSAAQVRAKQELFQDALQRTAGLSTEDFEMVPPASAQAWEYRSRVAFHVDVRQERVGFLGQNSHDLVEIPACPVLVPRLSQLLQKPAEWLFGNARRHGRLSRGNRNSMGPGISSSFVRLPVFAGDHEVTCDDSPVTATVAAVPFKVSASVFFQSNQVLMPVLVDFVRSSLVGTHIMDLYAGVGTFSAYAERDGYQVTAVEREPRCLDLASINAPGTRFFTSPAESWRPRKGVAVDTVVVDPPRTGLAPSVPSLIASWRPLRIVYVSCDSVTLARDLRKFVEEGYSPCRAQVFDLYPQTSHYESAVVLERRKN